jgi:phytoene synthase
MSTLSDTAMPRPGSSLQLAVLSAGFGQIRLGAWVRWWHEVSQIPASVSDPSVADRKLAWWAQAVADAFKQPAQHPLLRALQDGAPTLDAQAVPPLALWLEQIEGLRVLTQQTRWMDEATLLRHIRATTGAACEGAAWVCGARQPATLALARRLGTGLRRAHILARLGQDAQDGWLHIPIDVLQKHDVKAHELLRPASIDTPPAIRALLADWRQRAMRDIDAALSEARALTPGERRALRPLAVLSQLYVALMDDLDKSGYPVLKQRTFLGPWRKLWTAQRARWRWR